MASSEGGGPSVYIHTHMPRDGDPPAGFTCTRTTADDLTRHTSNSVQWMELCLRSTRLARLETRLTRLIRLTRFHPVRLVLRFYRGTCSSGNTCPHYYYSPLIMPRCWPHLFGRVTFFLISLLFFIVTAITASLIAVFNYNTVPNTGWVLVGGLSENGATFRIRIPPSSQQQNGQKVPSSLSISTSSNQGDAEAVVFTSPISTDDGNNTRTLVESITVTDLASETQYYYWTRDRFGAVLKRGRFTTPAPAGTQFNFTIATGGCAWMGSENDVFNHIAEEDPLMFVQLGDFHYEDINSDDVSVRLNAIDTVLGSPSQENLYRSTSFVSMWDDHDWLGDDSRGYCPVPPEECQGRASALESYRLAYPYPEPLPAEDDSQGVYHAFTIGSVRFIISDLRSEQSDVSIYSEEQKTWLFNEIANAAAYDFVVWITPAPWVGKAKEDDSWFGFPEDRAELSDYITTTIGCADGCPRNLIALSADAHMLAFDDGRNTYYGSSAPSADVFSFPIVMSGPLDRIGSIKGGPFSDGCTTNELEIQNQYSTLDFVFSEEEGSCIDITQYTINRGSKEVVRNRRLCGQIFQATENLGSGSCSSSLLSNSFTAIVAISGAFCAIALILCCRSFDRCWATSTCLTILLTWILIYVLGVYIPRGAMKIANFEIRPVAVISCIYTAIICVYILCWNRKIKAAKKKNNNRN